MKNGFFQTVKSVFSWLASLVEDKAGSVSTKRILALWAMWVLQNAYKTPGFENSLIWPLIVLIATLVGATLPEWFSKLKSGSNEN